MNHTAFRPLKPRQYGSAAHIIADAVEAGGGLKQVAEKLGKSRSSVAGYTDPNARQRMTIEAALDWAKRDRAAARKFAEPFANSAGMALLPVEDRPPESMEILAGDTAKECAEVVAAALRLKEKTKASACLLVLKEIDDLLAAATALRARILADIEGHE